MLFNSLEEAKRLQKKFKEQELKYGPLPCYCDQGGSAECPIHIEAFIDGLQRQNTNNKELMRGLKLKYKFGITLDQYNYILKQQKDSCKVCEKHKSLFKKSFAVDHDHEAERLTGKIIIRGLLCPKCNVGLGQFDDSPTLLRQAANYLERKNEKR